MPHVTPPRNDSQISRLLAVELAPYCLGTDAGRAVELGEFQLKNNPALCLEICNHVAETSKAFLTYDRFQKLFQISPEAPIEPQLDNLDLGVPPNGVTGKAAKVWRAKQLFLATKTYEQDAKAYSELAIQIRTLRAHYLPDRAGYLAYCLDAFQGFEPDDLQNFFFRSNQFRISEAARQRHTFITGGTGSGKSETIKKLIRHYETKCTDTAVIILDPHGKLATEIAQFKEHAQSDRLVLIQPNLHPDHRVSLNPFDAKDKSIGGLEVQSAHLLGALEQIVDGFTLNMESLLTPVLTTLLHRDGSTITDLVRFMDDRLNRDLLTYGQTELPYEEHRHFFRHQFHSQNYESTKDALQNRFQALLSKPTIKRFCGEASTFDLEDLIEQRKIIVFSFSITNMGQQTVRVLGQLMTAMIKGYCVRRAGYKGSSKIPIQFFADECQYFVSRTTEEILGESRKYGLHLNLATQRTEQVGEKVLDAILGNVGVFLIGRNRGKTITRLSRETDTDADTIRDLKVGEFIVSEMGKKPVQLKVPFVGHNHRMSKDDWQRVLRDQLSQYYAGKVQTSSPQVASSPKQPAEDLPMPDLNALAQAARNKPQGDA